MSMGPRLDNDEPRAVVIGAGIGGAVATLLLAHAGIKTTLLEKNRRIGGSCSGYDKQGFHIDIGTHMFCRGDKGPLGEVLRRVGRPGEIAFRRTRDIAELRMPAPDAGTRGGAAHARPWSPAAHAGARRTADAGAPGAAHVATPGPAEDPADIAGILRIPVPADLRRMPAFCWTLCRTMRLSPREMLQAARLFARILTMGPAEISSWDHRTVEELVTRYTDHAAVTAVFGFLLGLYFILPYWEVSAGEAIWAFQRMARDNALSYPLGGSIAVPGTYCRLAEALGAEIRTGVAVRRVVIADGHDDSQTETKEDSQAGGGPRAGRATGVELADGTVLPARIVVSTSSLRTTVLRLCGAAHFPADYVERARAVRGSYIAVQVKIGLSQRLVSAGAIVGGVGEQIDLLRVTRGDLREMFSAVTQGRIPEVVPIYCPVPSNFDETLAPPGCQLLTACAVAPTSDVRLQDPGPAWEEALLRTLRRIVPGLDRHTMFVDRFSVDFIERWIGKEFGPAVSTGQTPDQVGDLRPRVFTPLRGLYLAGCCAGGRGVGTELAAASAMECVDQILADLGRDLRPPPRMWDAGAGGAGDRRIDGAGSENMGRQAAL